MRKTEFHSANTKIKVKKQNKKKIGTNTSYKTQNTEYSKFSITDYSKQNTKYEISIKQNGTGKSSRDISKKIVINYI